MHYPAPSSTTSYHTRAETLITEYMRALYGDMLTDIYGEETAERLLQPDAIEETMEIMLENRQLDSRRSDLPKQNVESALASTKSILVKLGFIGS